MESTFHTSTPVLADRVDSFRATALAKPQKAFAIAFAALTAALAGCASGLGVNGHETASASAVARVAEGTVVGSQLADAQAGRAYTIRLPSGELVSVAQAGDYSIPSGTAVLIEYGAKARVIPQSGYSS